MAFSNDKIDNLEIDNLFERIIALYNALMKTFPDLVVILDLAGKIINISRNVQDFYTLKSKDDFIGKNIIDLIVPEDQKQFEKDLVKALSQGFLKMVEYNFLGENYSSFIGELSLSLIKNKKSEPNFFIGIIRDITNQKKIESELRDNKQMFQLVMDNIPQLISWKDVNSIYIGCNSNFARVAGLENPSEITGKTDYELPWKVSETESFFEIDQLVMNTNKPEQHIILPQLQADGKEAWLDANKIPLLNLDENVVGLLSTYEDITDRLKSEKALKKSEKRYREAYNRAEFYKDVFAHDVSNILQGILSSIEMCKLGLNDTQGKINLVKFYDIIEDQVNRGVNLVSNIRKISSIDDMENSLTLIELCKIIEVSLENVHKMFPKKQIITDYDVEYDEIFVIANNLLQDVIDNILHNAVKHNNNPIIKITVIISKLIKNNIKYIKLEFIDNGLGISDTHKTTIFKRGALETSSFYRLGLGLSLVKRLVESYDGSIWVEDRIEGDYTKGSKFNLLIKEYTNSF
ncbi:MAG: PAS domain-containing sensor histidine kinase [Candidatus Lokiarchaeota archaeon]|nr:PAS domain-containing sensor histidine kinase [Candidatus Lokiarchaeota archaeon]